MTAVAPSPVSSRGSAAGSSSKKLPSSVGLTTSRAPASAPNQSGIISSDTRAAVKATVSVIAKPPAPDASVLPTPSSSITQPTQPVSHASLATSPSSLKKASVSLKNASAPPKESNAFQVPAIASLPLQLFSTESLVTPLATDTASNISSSSSSSSSSLISSLASVSTFTSSSAIRMSSLAPLPSVQQKEGASALGAIFRDDRIDDANTLRVGTEDINMANMSSNRSNGSSITTGEASSDSRTVAFSGPAIASVGAEISSPGAEISSPGAEISSPGAAISSLGAEISSLCGNGSAGNAGNEGKTIMVVESVNSVAVELVVNPYGERVMEFALYSTSANDALTQYCDSTLACKTDHGRRVAVALSFMDTDDDEKEARLLSLRELAQYRDQIVIGIVDGDRSSRSTYTVKPTRNSDYFINLVFQIDAPYFSKPFVEARLEFLYNDKLYVIHLLGPSRHALAPFYTSKSRLTPFLSSSSFSSSSSSSSSTSISASASSSRRLTLPTVALEDLSTVALSTVALEGVRFVPSFLSPPTTVATAAIARVTGRRNQSREVIQKVPEVALLDTRIRVGLVTPQLVSQPRTNPHLRHHEHTDKYNPRCSFGRISRNDDDDGDDRYNVARPRERSRPRSQQRRRGPQKSHVSGLSRNGHYVETSYSLGTDQNVSKHPVWDDAATEHRGGGGGSGSGGGGDDRAGGDDDHASGGDGDDDVDWKCRQASRVSGEAIASSTDGKHVRTYHAYPQHMRPNKSNVYHREIRSFKRGARHGISRNSRTARVDDSERGGQEEEDRRDVGSDGDGDCFNGTYVNPADEEGGESGGTNDGGDGGNDGDGAAEDGGDVGSGGVEEGGDGGEDGGREEGDGIGVVRKTTRIYKCGDCGKSKIKTPPLHKHKCDPQDMLDYQNSVFYTPKKKKPSKRAPKSASSTSTSPVTVHTDTRPSISVVPLKPKPSRKPYVAPTSIANPASNSTLSPSTTTTTTTAILSAVRSARPVPRLYPTPLPAPSPPPTSSSTSSSLRRSTSSTSLSPSSSSSSVSEPSSPLQSPPPLPIPQTTAVVAYSSLSSAAIASN